MIAYSSIAMTILDPVITSVQLPVSQTWLKTVIGVLSCFIAAQWYVPNCAELCISLMIFTEYCKFYKAFSKKIDASGKFDGCLETERKRYVAMLRVVEAADKTLTLHHGAAFIGDIGNLCLCLYCIAYYRSQTDQVAPFVIWLILTLCDVIIKCTSGILVNYGVTL